MYYNLRNATLRVRNREKSILMNDVWETDDGIRWKLTSPGCRPEVLQETHSQDNGHERTTCTNDGDCWGVKSVCRTVAFAKCGHHVNSLPSKFFHLKKILLMWSAQKLAQNQESTYLGVWKPIRPKVWRKCMQLRI